MVLSIHVLVIMLVASIAANVTLSYLYQTQREELDHERDWNRFAHLTGVTCEKCRERKQAELAKSAARAWKQANGEVDGPPTPGSPQDDCRF